MQVACRTRSLRVLLQGSAAAGDEHGEPWPTLWDAYRQWGYVSMFGEAGCGGPPRATPGHQAAEPASCAACASVGV